MKKLFITFITGLLISCLCLMFPVIAQSSTKTFADEQTTETLRVIDYDKALYKFSVTTPEGATGHPVVIGPNRETTLADGESVVMQFTLVSSSIAWGDAGFYIGTPANIPSDYPAAGKGRIAIYARSDSDTAGFYTTGGGAFVEPSSTEGNAGYGYPDHTRGTIFKSGNQIKVVYTPAQSETELGTVNVYYRSDLTAEFTEGYRVTGLTEDSVGRTAGIYLITNTNTEWVLKDYTITTTGGTNLLTYQVKDPEDGNAGKGTWHFGYGKAFAYNTCTLSMTAQDPASYTLVDEKSSGMSYIGPNVGATIGEGQTLNLEFDVISSNIQCDFGFYASWLTAVNNLSGELSGYGSWLHATSGSVEAQSSGAVAGTDYAMTKSVSSMLAAGNSVKVVYKPYVSDSDLGYMKVFVKTPNATDYEQTMYATGLGNKAASEGVYLRLMWQTGTPSLTFSNFREYLYTESTGATTPVFDSTVGAEFTCSGSNSEQATYCYLVGETVDVKVEEYKIAYGSSLSTDVAKEFYALKGAQITVTADSAPEKKVFTGWSDGANIVSNDLVYTFTVDKELNLTATYDAIRYAVNVTGGTVNGATSANVAVDDEVTVTATVPEGYNFVCWKVDGEQVSADLTYTFTVTKAVNLTAEFAIQTFTVSVTGGTISTVKEKYDYNETIIITADDKQGYTFDGWYDGENLVSEDKEYQITVKGNITLEAKYTEIPKEDGCGGSIGASTYLITLTFIVAAAAIIVTRKKYRRNK